VDVPLISNDTLHQKTTGLYLQQELTFSDRVIASVGLRNDWLDLSNTDNMPSGVRSNNDVSEFSKRVGLSYKITDEIATYVSYAESVAPPSDGVLPETGKQYEIGIKYRPTEFPALFSAAIYDLTKENITRNVGSPPLPTTVGKVKSRGIDLEAKAEVTDSISLMAAYSYVDTEIKDAASGNAGNQLALVPNHLASLWTSYTWAGNGIRGDMTFGLGARYTGSAYFGDANTSKSDSAVVFDAAYNYQIRENTSFQLNVSNLFDEKHVANGGFGADWYNPGREITATLR
jgi:iron complex outermembrane receptor protein